MLVSRTSFTSLGAVWWLGLLALTGAALGARGLDLGADLFFGHRLDVGGVQAFGHLHESTSGLAAHGFFQQPLDGVVVQKAFAAPRVLKDGR